MRLIRLEIVNFGKLHDYAVDLRDGLNVFCEGNGFGKSTLAAFIKAMLYGLPANRTHSLDKNERKKYAPWQGGPFGGSIEFSTEKGSFRLERFFGAKESADEFRLFDLSTNRPSNAYSRDAGIDLFGIDADGFEKSVYLSQIPTESPRGNVTVTAKLTGLFEEVNDMGSYDIAMNSLEKLRRRYEVKGGKGRVAELTNALIEEQAAAERCRELLPLQDQQQMELNKKNEELRLAEQEQKQNNGLLRLTEEKKRHEEECRRAEATISDWERQRGEILDGFRDRRIPTDEELALAKKQLSDFRVLQGKSESVSLTGEEEARIDRLKQSYPTGVPSDSTVAGLRAKLTQFNTLRTKLEATAPSESTRDQRRFERTGIPESTVLDSATEQLDRAEQLQRRLDSIAKSPIEKKRRIPLLPSLLVAFLGALLAVLGAVLTDWRLPLLSVGGVLLVAGTLMLLLGRADSDQKAEVRRAEEQKRLRAELDTATNAVTELLRRYNSLPADGHYRRAMTDLCVAAERAKADGEAQSKQKQTASELQASIGRLEAELTEEFAKAGITPFPKDPQATLNQLFSDTREWQELTKRSEQTQTLLQSLRTEMKSLQDMLVSFFDRLAEKPGRMPEDCMRAAEELCRDHATLLGNIRQKKQELSDRRREYANTAPTSLPEAEELEARALEIQETIERLTNERDELKRAFSRTVEQTKELPELEDRCEHLKEEQRQAQSDLELLKKTEELLTASKEALSTRYLGGMQQHFSHYRTLLQGESGADAAIDTAFEITVREGGRAREAESFSRGTRDVLQFCARLALTRSMFAEGELPFLLLDDPFVNLDREHLAAARSLLDKLAEELQIVYFVCHPTRS